MAEHIGTPLNPKEAFPPPGESGFKRDQLGQEEEEREVKVGQESQAGVEAETETTDQTAEQVKISEDLRSPDQQREQQKLDSTLAPLGAEDLADLLNNESEKIKVEAFQVMDNLIKRSKKQNPEANK